MTYGYVTKAAINGLLEYAEISNRSLAQLPPINFASYLDPGDELPEGVADSDVGMMGKLSYSNTSTYRLIHILCRQMVGQWGSASVQVGNP
jgi:hypothetical protein